MNKFNDWYDRLPEPWRFGLFMSVMALAVFPLQLGVTYGHKESMLCGLGLLTVMVFIAVTRAFKMSGVQHKIMAGLMFVLLLVIFLGVFVL